MMVLILSLASLYWHMAMGSVSGAWGYVKGPA